MPDLKQPQINSLIISGRLTADPEVKSVGSDGKYVCNTSIATDSGWGDNKKSIFLDCTCWGKTAEIIGELKKGSPVVLEGRIHMDEWEDRKTGAKRTKIAMTVNRVHGLAWDTARDHKPEESESTPF
ncbi:hypothetical protein LCGC14_1948770 [marine sediment metagenome]|uniref:Single-stranded DNA-binding protein n=1 Tax=marine sediment metagenome TaxID=412755 RepID=A0A0F9G6F8_9ZZZZ